MIILQLFLLGYFEPASLLSLFRSCRRCADSLPPIPHLFMSLKYFKNLFLIPVLIYSGDVSVHTFNVFQQFITIIQCSPGVPREFLPPPLFLFTLLLFGISFSVLFTSWCSWFSIDCLSPLFISPSCSSVCHSPITSSSSYNILGCR